MKRLDKNSLDTAAIGLEMGGCVLVGYLLGRWFDSSFDTAPYGFWFFLLAGFGAAAKGVIRVIRKYRKQTLRDAEEHRRMLLGESTEQHASTGGPS